MIEMSVFVEFKGVFNALFKKKFAKYVVNSIKMMGMDHVLLVKLKIAMNVI